MNFEIIFSILCIGFNLCFAIYLLFRFYFDKKSLYLLYLAFISIFFSAFISLEIFEKLQKPSIYISKSQSLLLDFVVISFYLFMYSFLGNKKNKLVKYALFSGILFLFLAVIVEILLNFFKIFEIIDSIVSHLFVFFDIGILVILILVLYKNRNNYLKYIFHGLLFLLFMAIIIHIGRYFLNIFNYISQLNLLEIEVLIGFCFIFLSILSFEKEKILEIESEKAILEVTHHQTIEELQKTKELVIEDHIVLKNNAKIYLEKLLYIKAEDHYLELITTTKKEFVRGKISEIRLELPPNFVKCHRSFIVNINYISIYLKTEVKLENGTLIPLSRGFVFK
jgi:hypothetical protein